MCKTKYAKGGAKLHHPPPQDSVNVVNHQTILNLHAIVTNTAKMTQNEGRVPYTIKNFTNIEMVQEH